METIELNKFRRNKKYRKILYTDDNIQIVAMYLKYDETIKFERHDGTQSIIVLEGKIKVINDDDNIYIVSVADTIIIPPHELHGVLALADSILYVTYSPPEHEY